MLDDTKWAGAHFLAALSHGALSLTGTFFFIFGYHGFDAPFDKAATLPWATMPFVSRHPTVRLPYYLLDTNSRISGHVRADCQLRSL